MKKLLTIISFLLLASFSFAQSFPFDMIAHDGSTGSDYAFDVCVDNAGNKLITGKYKGEIDFGNGVVISPIDNYDIFVAKYDMNNNIQWAKSFGGHSADEGNAITTDSNGNVIVTGVFFQSMYIDTDTLYSAGTFDVFVVKFDPDGNYLWMKHGYTENYDKPTDIQVDNNGNYVLLGYYDVNDSLTLPFNFEGLQLTTSQGERDVFVIKMDSNGNPLWGVTGGGADNDYSGGLAIDSNNNIYFDGNYDNVEANFGGTILPNEDGYEVFLAKLDSTGTYQWAVAATGAGDDKAYDIEYIDRASDPGLIVVTGQFEDSLYAGTANELFESVGDDDIYVLGYTENGDYESGWSFGGIGEDQAKAISYIPGSEGDYFVSGVTKSDIDLPNAQIVNYGSRDAIVICMHQNELVWAKNYGGDSYDYLNSSAADKNGSVYFAGNFKSSTATFNPFSLVTNGSYDLWLGQMHVPLPHSAPVISSIVDIPEDQGGKVRLSFSGSELSNSFTIWRQIDSTSEWDAVGSFDGLYKRNYSYVAPTLGDSTIHGIHWSTFKVSAHTQDIHESLVSEPQSGYSIDNLAPVVPGGIIAEGLDEMVQLAWNESAEKDFQYYAIYRSLDPEFNVDTMNTFTYSTTDNFYNDVNVVQGNTYYYSVVAVDYSGNYSEASEKAYALVTDVDSEIDIPTVYELGQNYPNPFNPTTVISFALPESGMVTLKVFNLLGEEVTTLVNRVMNVGTYDVSFDASNLTTGMYIYRIQSGDFTSTKKMMLIK